jgi:hypothetical protein
VILTENLDPYILEFNKGPSLKPANENDEILKYGLIEEMFETTGIISRNKSGKNRFSKLYEIAKK